MSNKVLATLYVNEDFAISYGEMCGFEYTTPIEYVIKEMDWLESSGISIESVCDADESIKECVAAIIDVFEEILDANDIDIPDENREGNEEKARIYGKTYYYIEDKIKEILSQMHRN